MLLNLARRSTFNATRHSRNQTRNLGVPRRAPPAISVKEAWLSDPGTYPGKLKYFDIFCFSYFFNLSKFFLKKTN